MRVRKEMDGTLSKDRRLPEKEGKLIGDQEKEMIIASKICLFRYDEYNFESAVFAMVY